MLTPVVDDPFCSRFANDHKIIVISLDYPKAPSHKYPAAVNALTDLVKAVLSDETLPLDKKKVAIGGFSAGANLALAVSQNHRDKIGGVVAFYPAVDFVTKGPEKMKTRPDGAPPDLLEVRYKSDNSVYEFGTYCMAPIISNHKPSPNSERIVADRDSWRQSERNRNVRLRLHVRRTRSYRSSIEH